MKTRFFYFFAVGVCALLLILLLTVHHKDEQKPQLAKQDSHQKLIPKVLPNKDNSTTTPPAAPKEKNPNAKPITAFQYITDQLNKMGITANGVDVNMASSIVNWSPDSKWGEYYGDPSSKSQAIAPIILELHQALKANPQEITGCYQTKWGLLRLYVKDDVVAGTFFYYGRNHIIGKLKDNILVGLWIRPANNKRPIVVGPVQFAFAEGWSSFKSVWRYKKEPQFKSKWVGTKIPCPAKGTKLTQNLVPGGPGVPVKAKPGQGKPGLGKPGQPKPGQAKPGNPTEGKMPQKSPPSAQQ